MTLCNWFISFFRTNFNILSHFIKKWIFFTNSFHFYKSLVFFKYLYYSTHLRKLVLQFHLLIEHPTGIKKFLQRQFALLMPFFQLFICWILFNNMSFRILYLMTVQPFLSLLTGRTFWIPNK